MGDIGALRQSVQGLYQANTPGRADWADWIYEGHVLLVAQEARRIAERFGGDPDLAEAAALLHDIADSVLKREDSLHEQKSFEIARDLLKASGYTPEDIAVVVDDAITNHGCHGDVRPQTKEGKAMAAADGVVHMNSDFYTIATERRSASETPKQIAQWALPKIERDFNNKIAFDALREEVRPYYERHKTYFLGLLAVD